MSENYRFFDSIDGEDERFYTADEFAEYFRQFIRNGIFSGGENLKVVTDEKDMRISIKPGYAWIEGYLYKISGEDLILEHSIADPSLNRIDRVVIRLDKTLENRYVKAFILEGTPEQTPKAPELTRNDNIYEISLAKIDIIAGKSFIENYHITDERLDNTVCGLTTHLFEQIDTVGIFDEWQRYLIHKRNVSNLIYDEFVTEYQNIWNSWIEEKIIEPSGEFYAEWKTWFNEVQDTTNLVTKSQFDEHKEDYVQFKTEAELNIGNARKILGKDIVVTEYLDGGTLKYDEINDNWYIDIRGIGYLVKDGQLKQPMEFTYNTSSAGKANFIQEEEGYLRLYGLYGYGSEHPNEVGPYPSVSFSEAINITDTDIIVVKFLQNKATQNRTKLEVKTGSKVGQGGGTILASIDIPTITTETMVTLDVTGVKGYVYIGFTMVTKVGSPPSTGNVDVKIIDIWGEG